MLKVNTRHEYLTKRLQLSHDELQDKTVLMAYQFSLLKMSPLYFLFSYYPLLSRNEFDVSVCEQAMRQKFPDIKVAWPKTDIDMSSMEAYLVDQDGLFAKNKFNILEPLTGTLVKPEQIDMVFVPLLAFDKNGYRVGYGKGFYDRYLSRCRADVIKVGFSFFEATDPLEDINEFDVPLSFCITPIRLYEF